MSASSCISNLLRTDQAVPTSLELLQHLKTDGWRFNISDVYWIRNHSSTVVLKVNKPGTFKEMLFTKAIIMPCNGWVEALPLSNLKQQYCIENLLTNFCIDYWGSNKSKLGLSFKYDSKLGSFIIYFISVCILGETLNQPSHHRAPLKI